MRSRRFFVAFFCALTCTGVASHAIAQSASVLYTFDNSGNAVPNIEAWIRSFGAGGTAATLDNNISGTLTLTETGGTAGGSQAFSDGFNRVRESPTGASGGLDLTGLDYLEWDLGHNGANPINVQFYAQASTGSTFKVLGGDLAVTPGMNTYQVPLSSLSATELVYVRTLGINIRDHAAQGNLVWSVNEVRSGGTELLQRRLITHNPGTPEGGLQGAIVNFGNAAVQGNDGGPNQTGLSHSTDAGGSLQWTDLGAAASGGAISWGNGTAWNGNTFNNRTTDLSNYENMVIRMKATDPNNGGGTLGVQGFFQKNNFAFEAAEGGSGKNLPIDGEYHELVWSLAGLSNMNVVDLTGINLFNHAQDLIINVDYVRFNVPEPASLSLLGIAVVGCLGIVRRSRRV